METRQIKDAIRIGSFNEVDEQGLKGLVIEGLEMKFGVENANGEVYEKGCFDAFLKDYFVDNGLNLPLTLMHEGGFDGVIGKVLSIDLTDDAFKVRAYIPDYLPNYEVVKSMIQDGILQGFSKEGWATDYFFDKNDVMHIKEMALGGVSIVTLPANGLKFDEAKPVDNDLKVVFPNQTLEDILFN